MAAMVPIADMRIVAFITEAAPVRRILNHIGEPAEPPREFRSAGVGQSRNFCPISVLNDEQNHSAISTTTE
jgi:hypothetical protein